VLIPTEPATANELGALLGISGRAVREHAAKGIIPKTRRGRYRLAEAVPAYCSHMRDLLTNKGGAAAVLSGTAERARLAREQADAVAFKNAVARGALLDAAEVGREWSAILVAIRARMLAASSRCGSRLPHLTQSDLAEFDREIRDGLTELGGGDGSS
jgi:terminase small subunit / prophage DNA-packing protein